MFLPCQNINNDKIAQSWTALFRAFSSHRQPSAIFSKVFPAEQTSWPNWQTLWACTEADDKIDYIFLYTKNFVKTRGSFLLKI